MSDHREEQEMEKEALSAIFDTFFAVLRDTQPFQWSVQLMPVDCSPDEQDALNHVSIELRCTLPLDYPELSLPELEIHLIKGLTAADHQAELWQLAMDEASNQAGMPAVFAICEVLREWLVDHNVKGLDDASMHAQMMRRTQESERKQAQTQQEFEAQKDKEEMTQTEQEDLEVRRRRAEGTPCNKENFDNWKRTFEAEMAHELLLRDQATRDGSNSKKADNLNKLKEDKSKRLTGYEQFSDKQSGISMEAIEAAAEEAEKDEIDPEELDVDEDLFDVDDDDDLDDLDFDDEGVDYDDQEEPDI